MKKNGFTLIELLAVIIILGVLMIIAIPSVTRYIDESRRNGYISTAKNLVGGARNLIYSGELDLSDTDTTYYIEGKCIATDNAYKSPYGEFGEKRAYVVVTSTNDNYEYYWVSVDNTGTGVESIKKVDELEIEDIVSGIDTGEIDTNIGIDKRKNIVVVGGENCTKSAPKLAEHMMNSTTGQIKNACPAVTDTIYWAINNNKLTISDSLVSGAQMGNFPGNSDFSESAPTWAYNYELYYNISEVEVVGTVAPTSTARWFRGIGIRSSNFDIDLSNLEVCNVTNMKEMFSTALGNGTTTSLNISGLENWDTSNVTDMSYMFTNFGDAINSINLNLSGWDTSKVSNIYSMFYYFGQHATTLNLNLSNWDLSNTTNLGNVFYSTGHVATTLSINVSNWNTRNVTSMDEMFERMGAYSTNLTLEGLNTWNTSNVTSMNSVFYYLGRNATSVIIDISSWNTSKVEQADLMFYDTGYFSSEFNITIPRTNGNGLNNTTTVLYGKDSTVSIVPPYINGPGSERRNFTLAS